RINGAAAKRQTPDTMGVASSVASEPAPERAVVQVPHRHVDDLPGGERARPERALSPRARALVHLTPPAGIRRSAPVVPPRGRVRRVAPRALVHPFTCADVRGAASDPHHTRGMPQTRRHISRPGAPKALRPEPASRRA